MKKIVLYLLIGIFAISCAPKPVYYQESGVVFNTLYQIKYEAPRPLTNKIDAELQAFNLSLNPFLPQSIVARVNRNEPVEVDEWFSHVFLKAQEVSKRTGGMFDVTVSPIINLWGFGFEPNDTVTPERIDSLKQFVGYQKVRLEGKKLVKDDPRMTLNFSAIAKGYACDVIAQLLEREGVRNYMVDIGGEVTVKGVNQNGKCWGIGISQPQEGAQELRQVHDVVYLCQPSGLATSGNYRNYFEKDGKKYGHTIHPFTGYPAEQNILSATVVAPNCMTADAYATAFMVMGLDEACRLADQIPEIGYYFIYLDEAQEMQVRYSNNIEQQLSSKQ